MVSQPHLTLPSVPAGGEGGGSLRFNPDFLIEENMKIYYLMPGNYGPDYCTDKETYLTPYTSPGTDLQVFTTGDTATLSIISVVDMALIGPATVARVIEAEKTGFDGVILGAT